jgi:type IV secretion system protein VirB9
MKPAAALLCILLLLASGAAVALLLASCASADMEKRVRPAGPVLTPAPQAPQPIPVPIETHPVETKIVEVEKPVYVPPEDPKSPEKPRAAPGYDSVAASNKEGILKPQGYEKAAMIYDYHPDWVYEVYTQTFRVTDIYLKAGETASGAPFISDSERWQLGAAVSGGPDGKAVQHIYVKPTAANLSASLIINTSERVYHITLRSYENAYMPMVRWKYPETGLPNTFAGQGREAPGMGAPQGEDSPLAVDPRFLSFDYRITYPLFAKPSWIPSLVYDDGRKTYIAFPESVLLDALPGVFENRSGVVNYRVIRNIVIIDRLIETVTVKLGGREIKIEKKKGRL